MRERLKTTAVIRLLPLAALIAIVCALTVAPRGGRPGQPPPAEAEFSRCGSSGWTMTIRARTPDVANTGAYVITGFGVTFSHNPLTGQPGTDVPMLDNGTGVIVLPNICVGDEQEYVDITLNPQPANCSFFGGPKIRKDIPTPRQAPDVIDVVFISDQTCVRPTQTPTFTPIATATATATPTPLPGTIAVAVTVAPVQPQLGCGESTLVNVTVNTLTGAAAPDGTLVTLTSSVGAVNPPQAPTTNGRLSAVLTAPNDSGGNASVIATSRSVSNFATVQVNCGAGAPATPSAPSAPLGAPPPPASAAAAAAAAAASASGLIIRPPNTGSAGLGVIDRE